MGDRNRRDQPPVEQRRVMRATDPRAIADAAAFGASAFARRVLHRYRWQVAARPPVAQVYRRLAAPLMIVRRPVQVRLAPAFDITLAANATPRASTNVISTAMGLLLRREVNPTAPEAVNSSWRRGPESAEQEQGRRFVERLFAREERVTVQTSPEALVRALTTSERASGSLRTSTRTSALMASPVERVLRRSPAPVEAQTDGGAMDGWGTPIGPRRPVPRAVVDAAELDRLTDHVMRTLDRRVAAHRERHGRL